MLTQEQIRAAVAEGRAFVLGVNRRERVTRQRVLSVNFRDDGTAFVCTTVSPYVVPLDRIEVRPPARLAASRGLFSSEGPYANRS